MASAQIDGVLKFYRVTTSGSKVFIFGGHTKALGPSGSADAAIGSTPEKWLLLPVMTGLQKEKVLNVNEKLHVTFTPTAAATTDASDATWSVPIAYADGSTDTLNGPSDTVTWDVFVLGDVALIAGREYPVCEKTVRMPFAIGGGRIHAGIENNA